ncbi:hypothetical protein ACWY4P_33240 [Streptomyces sp. LZ34]
MSGHRYETLPRTLKLSGDVRLHDGQFVVGVRVLRGEVYIGTELALISIDDASLMNAQLTRLLNERAFPGMGQRQRDRQRARWGL